jgi:hypothetical protein
MYSLEELAIFWRRDKLGLYAVYNPNNLSATFNMPTYEKLTAYEDSKRLDPML